jgi:hypothetical protein
MFILTLILKDMKNLCFPFYCRLPLNMSLQTPGILQTPVQCPVIYSVLSLLLGNSIRAHRWAQSPNLLPTCPGLWMGVPWPPPQVQLIYQSSSQSTGNSEKHFRLLVCFYFIFLYLGGARASYLLGKCSATWVTPQPCSLVYLFTYFLWWD